MRHYAKPNAPNGTYPYYLFFTGTTYFLGIKYLYQTNNEMELVIIYYPVPIASSWHFLSSYIIPLLNTVLVTRVCYEDQLRI